MLNTNHSHAPVKIQRCESCTWNGKWLPHDRIISTLWSIYVNVTYGVNLDKLNNSKPNDPTSNCMFHGLYQLMVLLRSFPFTQPIKLTIKQRIVSDKWNPSAFYYYFKKTHIFHFKLHVKATGWRCRRCRRCRRSACIRYSFISLMERPKKKKTVIVSFQSFQMDT